MTSYERRGSRLRWPRRSASLNARSLGVPHPPNTSSERVPVQTSKLAQERRPTAGIGAGVVLGRATAVPGRAAADTRYQSKRGCLSDVRFVRSRRMQQTPDAAAADIVERGEGTDGAACEASSQAPPDARQAQHEAPRQVGATPRQQLVEQESQRTAAGSEPLSEPTVSMQPHLHLRARAIRPPATGTTTLPADATQARRRRRGPPLPSRGRCSARRTRTSWCPRPPGTRRSTTESTRTRSRCSPAALPACSRRAEVPLRPPGRGAGSRPNVRSARASSGRE